MEDQFTVVEWLLFREWGAEAEVGDTTTILGTYLEKRTKQELWIHPRIEEITVTGSISLPKEKP